jgi:hypothetical protein
LRRSSGDFSGSGSRCRDVARLVFMIDGDFR